MLSVAKLRVGQEAYQLTGVAQSLDDYYTGAGEAPGVWAGVGAERLGLVGEVDGDDLRAVLAGIAPGSGGLSPNGEEIRPHPRRVPGFDLTFKAPKSLSVLYAVTDDPRVQGAIIEAGDAAVRATLGWIEREAVHVRRGSGDARWLADLAQRDPERAAANAPRVLPASGVVAAMFRHRTSRAGDPLLHWHTLVANLAEGPDGRWSAFVHPDLYQAVRAAGEVFQTALRAEVTERLGLEWRPGRHVGEIAGVPQRLCDQFSKRSREIEAWLEATATPNTPEGRQAAVLATRRNKPEVEDERFDAAWKAEAQAAGWGPEAAEALIAASNPEPAVPQIDGLWRLPEQAFDEHGSPYLYDRTVEPEEWIAHVARHDLTATASTFTKAELTQAVAARLGDGATVATIDRVVARAIASPELIPIESDGGQRWTSRELIGVERRFLDATINPTPKAPVPTPIVDQFIAARPSLGEDQAAAARALAGTERSVSVLVGPAGTGKTFTLDTIRTAYEASGYRVLGVAPSARAALELEHGAGIESVTIHRLLASWRHQTDAPNPDTIVVVDEAGMAGIRDLEAVVTATVHAGGRVMLVGDPHQLPEVGAGGGLAAAIHHADTVAELSVNRRQQKSWERDALAELRSGHVPAAIALYRGHDRVVVADDRQEMIDRAAERWIDARAAGQRPVLLAGTNDTVQALNQAVRSRLIATGLLDELPVARFAGRDFTVGDRVVLRRNSYRESSTVGAETAVLNGQSGTITGGSPSHLEVELDRSGVTVRLEEAYLSAGHLDHGYALTTHRAQGGTWDHAIAVGTDGLYREAAYVQLSRGATTNTLIVTRPELDDIDTELARHDHGIALPGDEPDDLDTDLHKRFTQTRAKSLALSGDPDAQAVHALASALSIGELDARARHARTVERHATDATGIAPAQAVAEIARARHTATHIAVGQQVKPVDRHNIGIVTRLDDLAGTVDVEFTSERGHQATRTFTWAQLDIVTPHNPTPRTLAPVVQAVLDHRIEPMITQLGAWHRHLAVQHVEPGDAIRYERAVELIIDRAAARLAATQPPWLTDLIGPRPDRAIPANVWDDTVHALAAHRTRHGLDDTRPGLGAAPTDPDQRHAWEQTASLALANRAWLIDHGTRPTVPIDTLARTPFEREERRAELETIFATAPPDQRDLISRLQTGDQLPFDNAAEILDQALATQGDRHQWILTHWPHIVEHAELDEQPSARTARPDRSDQLLPDL